MAFWCIIWSMKLSKWAKKEGITYKTAWLWFKKGLIKGAYTSLSGSIFVRDEEIKNITNETQTKNI